MDPRTLEARREAARAVLRQIAARLDFVALRALARMGAFGL